MAPSPSEPAVRAPAEPPAPVNGKPAARDELFELVYTELRAQAAAYLVRERADHTLEPTALVHEVWMRLVGYERLNANDEEHFLALAAQAMRRILIDHARGKQRLKRGGGSGEREELSTKFLARRDPVWPGDEDLLAVDRALAKLREQSQRMASIVELRFFGGLSREETARVLGASRSTIAREWRAARALMSRLLRQEEAEGATRAATP